MVSCERKEIGEHKLTSNAEFNLQKEGENAYKTFSAAADHKALKMIISTS